MGTACRAPTSGADRRALIALFVIIFVVATNRIAFDAWLTRFDLFTFFLPWYTFLGDRLRDFAVPGWNPHLFSGAPFAGDPESGWMYLPAMLAFALLETAAAFKAMVVTQLAVAAFSTFALARVLGMGAMAALVAAAVYVTGPFLHWNTNCCLIFSQFAAWIPLALLGIELALRATSWRDRVPPWALGGFAVSQMFAGWVGEGWLYAVLLPASYTGYRALLSPPRGGIALGERLRSGAATGVAVIGSGMALGAAGILPRLAFSAESNLAGGNYARLGEAGVLNPPWTLDYLLVQVLGEGAGYHVRAASLGGAVFVLALLAPVLAGWRFAAPFFAGLTLVAWILTLDTTPLHQLFYLIPRFREFHEHDAWRSMALAAIGPAMLSGATIESLPVWRGRRELLPVVCLPLFLLVIAAAVLARVEAFLGWESLLAAALTTGLVGVAVGLPNKFPHPNRGHAQGAPGTPPVEPGEGLGMRVDSRHRERPGQQPSSRTTWLIPAFILAIALIFPTGLELTGSWLGWPPNTHWEGQWRPDPAEASALDAEVSQSDEGGAGELLQRQRIDNGPFRYAGYGGYLHPGDPPRQESYMARRFEPGVRAVLVNGRPIYLGLFEIQGYNPLQLARYVEFMTALNGTEQDYHGAFLLPSGVRSPLLDLLDVRYVLIDAALPPDRDDVVALTAGRREVFRTPWAAVYERNPAPRHAWIVHDVRAVARGEALPLLASGAVDPYQTAFVEGEAPETRTPESAGSESARLIRYEPDRIWIEASAAAPGLLVVSEVYEAGWRASVDGEPAPVLPTDHALRGVPLPAGEHVVELRYEPPALRLGLAISGVTGAAMLVIFLASGLASLAKLRAGAG